MKRLTPILWGLVAAYAVVTFVITVFPGVIPIPVLIPLITLLPVAFALLHGARRHTNSIRNGGDAGMGKVALLPPVNAEVRDYIHVERIEPAHA